MVTPPKLQVKVLFAGFYAPMGTGGSAFTSFYAISQRPVRRGGRPVAKKSCTAKGAALGNGLRTLNRRASGSAGGPCLRIDINGQGG
jgi:hypothetical protein